MVMTASQDSPTSGMKAGTPHFPEVDKLPVKSLALESGWNEGLTQAADGFCRVLTNFGALVFSAVKMG